MSREAVSAGVFLSLVLVSSVAAAQPRDNTVKPGTAVLRGRVVASDSGRPIRRARVQLTVEGPGGGSRPPENRGSMTDRDGNYEFKALTAGRYIVTVSKGSYVTLSYGQRRPNEPGKPIEVLDGQHVEKVDFALPRGAILTGRILDEFGEPAEFISVSLVPAGEVQRKRVVNNGRFGSTNDLGEFRIVGVPPGQYYLSAMGYRPDDVDSDDRTSYAATFYPGTANISEARRLTLSVGQTLNDLSMTLVTTHTARVTGVVTDSQGRPMSLGFVMATSRNSPGLSAPASGVVKPDGSFVLTGLAPGEYLLMAFTAIAGVDEGAATATLTIAGQDVNGVQLQAAKPSTLSGRIVTGDIAGVQMLQFSQVLMHATPKEPMLAIGDQTPPARPSDDGTFAIKSRPGGTRITAASLAGNWTLKAVRLDGVDVTDAGVEVRANEDISGLEVELTNRTSMLSGVVTNARGQPVTDYSAIIFSQDRGRWGEDSRYFSTGRPDQDGRYKVSGLPAGEYFAIAVDSVDPAEAASPEFLERASARAVRFTLGDGETRSVDLKLTIDF
jgi:hypothetical protein